MSNEYANIGACPICGRDMLNDGKSVDEHHFTPKSQGGKVKTKIHRVCHRFIHSQWTEKKLANELNTPDKIKQTEEIQKFLSFISKKHPQFYDLTITSKQKRKR